MAVVFICRGIRTDPIQCEKFDAPLCSPALRVGRLRVLNEKHDKLVFLLWGGFAQRKGKLIDKSKHRVLEVWGPAAGNLGNLG